MQGDYFRLGAIYCRSLSRIEILIAVPLCWLHTCRGLRMAALQHATATPVALHFSFDTGARSLERQKPGEGTHGEHMDSTWRAALLWTSLDRQLWTSSRCTAACLEPLSEVPHLRLLKAPGQEVCYCTARMASAVLMSSVAVHGSCPERQSATLFLMQCVAA